MLLKMWKNTTGNDNWVQISRLVFYVACVLDYKSTKEFKCTKREKF